MATEGSGVSSCGSPAVCIYHYPCSDGIFAALAAKLRHNELNQPIRFVPLTVFKTHTVNEVGLAGGETVYFVDYTGPRGFVQGVAASAGRVIVLDHHKTAQDLLEGAADLPSNVELHIDMKRSGAVLALDYFKPQVSQQVDLMFRYIQDGDLWTWLLPDSKAFHAGLRALNLEMDANKNSAVFDTLMALKPEKVVQDGAAELAEQQRLVGDALTAAFKVQLGGAEGASKGWPPCLAVIGDERHAANRSALGNALAEASAAAGLAACGIVAYMEKEMAMQDGIKLSLRSIGDMDTTQVSQAFGGGGHKNASSCIIPAADFERWRLA